MQREHPRRRAGRLHWLALLLLPVPAAAQEADCPGLCLTYGIEMRLETTENLGLDRPSQGRTTEAQTRFSAALHSTTANQSFTLEGGAALRSVTGPDATPDRNLVSDPSLRLSYAREAANARLSLDARHDTRDITFQRPLTDFIGDDGEIDLPDNLDDLTGSGSRLDSDLRARLIWGERGPFGLTLDAGLSDLSYRDASDPSLTGSRRNSLGAELRFGLSEVADLTLGATGSTYDADGPAPRRDTLKLAAGIAIARPDGRVHLDIDSSKTEDGRRNGITIGRDFDLPTGRFSASLGAVRAASGTTYPTGMLRLRQDLPQGSLDALLSRAVASGDGDAETLQTLAVIGYSQPLSPLSSLSFSLTHAASEETATGTSERNTSLGLTLNRALTEDWGLDLGYRHRLQDQDTSGRADSDTVYVVLRRNFDLRF